MLGGLLKPMSELGTTLITSPFENVTGPSLTWLAVNHPIIAQIHSRGARHFATSFQPGSFAGATRFTLLLSFVMATAWTWT